MTITRSPEGRTSRRRLVAATSVLVLTAALTLGAAAVGPYVAPAAAEQLPTCPDGEGDGTVGPPLFTDNAVSVYVGGDFTAHENAAESEGLLVVHGDASFEREGLFNVGIVGAGSGAVPTPGSTMLAVGGNLTIGPSSAVDVGAGATGGGAVHVGGEIDGESRLVTNGAGAIENMGASALLPYDPDVFPQEMVDVSAELAAFAANGTAARSGDTVIFTAGPDDPTHSGLQVFEIDAASLNGTTALQFNGIPDGDSIVVNVTGGPVDFSPQDFTADGVRVDAFGFPGFGAFASSLMWNFTGDTDVSIGQNGQFMGSIMGPGINLTATTSTNGRLLVGGDYTMGGAGTEHHNYPWNYAFPCEDDVPPLPTENGSLTVTKSVAPGSGLTNLVFTGSARCTLTDGSIFIAGWSVRADEVTVFDSLPLDVRCVIIEDLDGVYEDVDGVLVPVDVEDRQWAEPVYTVDGVETDTFEITEDGQNITIDIDNTLLGTADVTKVVSGPEGGYVGDRTFDVDWQCSAGAYVDGVAVDPAVTSGTVSVAAGATVRPAVGGDEAWFPVGTTCTFTEAPLTEEPGDFASDTHEWTGSDVDPTDVVIGTGETGIVAVTVTNTFRSTVGGFEIAKALDGDAAAQVPADAVFTVRYSYALNGTTVSQDVQVPADGTSVAGPQDLPEGTVVTFEEIALPGVPGVTWGTPTITVDGQSTNRLVVGGGASAEVVVTNTADAVPTPTPTPTPSVPTTPDGDLATTGADIAMIAGLSVLFVAVGLAAVVARRRWTSGTK
ncbi:choice-of-anchor A family protein [Oerskovia turbata]|uniref:Choice-of-anchor A family protein n=1 Tax=Oerskovia turbata TaxID=1713 RepID=A0A4Q1KWD5_9CELL|nr:choice-of-anchor A family protein [Oerskovia turbata]RXR25379.1 choice-of-anchor A family protein [Oerskovia turbata]RXR33980.1 choice-of-anchor A family protein [Oerskovia turbata]TGJ95645.1 choice-of-anchor A family protein [Actinotalea fermentans ATCC 43279 = JCM 9966 = DSM 3133]